MTVGEVVTRGTIDVALLLYASVLAGNLWVLPLAGLPETHPWRRLARVFWTLGCAALWLHVAAAFGYYHHWSHAAATNDTAERTRVTLGVSFGGGIYFNYLFALVWTADCGWWWVARRSYERRPRWVGVVVQCYLLFIAINATIVFETGVVRAAGLVMAVALVGLAWRRWQVVDLKETD
jgi:hypothetical protein